MMSDSNADVVSRFCDAFARPDSATMAACDHPDVHFEGEVFDLLGTRAGAIWRMLCEGGQDHTVEASDIEADVATGRARRAATSTLSQTGRPVHNSVRAAFTFGDGLIRTHRYRFDFWAWSRQALELPGLQLGSTPWLRRTVRTRAARQLDRYLAQNPEARR